MLFAYLELVGSLLLLFMLISLVHGTAKSASFMLLSSKLMGFNSALGHDARSLHKLDILTDFQIVTELGLGPYLTNFHKPS